MLRARWHRAGGELTWEPAPALGPAVARSCGPGFELAAVWPLHRFFLARCRGCHARLWGRRSCVVLVTGRRTSMFEFCERCAP